jgi:hypothetical protein
MILTGAISISKRLRRHPVYDREPKCAMAAWIDMILLANDEDRVAHLNGKDIPVKRGQLVWSIRSLEREWKRSVEWIEKFLKFCKDETMILVEVVPRSHTLITILNYDAYNPVVSVTDSATEPGTESVTDSATEPGTESVTDSATEPAQKGEKGIGRRKGEAPPPLPSTIPEDAEVAAFCADFKDLALGIDGIPNVWWTGWLADKLNNSNRAFPVDWKRSLALAFKGDFAARHPKAMASIKKTGEKNGAQVASPAMELLLLDRELAEVRAEIAECDDLAKPVPKELKARRRDLEKKRAELTPQGGVQ